MFGGGVSHPNIISNNSNKNNKWTKSGESYEKGQVATWPMTDTTTAFKKKKRKKTTLHEDEKKHKTRKQHENDCQRYGRTPVHNIEQGNGT